MAIATIPPLLMSGICFIIAGSIFLCYSIVRSNDRKHITDFIEWKRSIIIGTIMLLGGQGLRTVGEVQLSSGMTSLTFAIVPLWIIIIGSLFFNKKISKLAASMIIIGFLGVVIIAVFFALEGSDSSSSNININMTALCSGNFLSIRTTLLDRCPAVGPGVDFKLSVFGGNTDPAYPIEFRDPVFDRYR